MGGAWCSLQELGPLCRLRKLEIGCLEAVPSGSLAVKARICDKLQLRGMALLCYKLLLFPSTDNAIKEMTQDKCLVMEEVVDLLCPPPALELLIIRK